MNISKTANVFFLIYSAHLVYCTFTLLGLSDPQLVLLKRLTLPFFGFRMAIDIFFVSTPFIALFFFLCFQAFLIQRPAPASQNGKYCPPIENYSYFRRLSNSTDCLQPRIIRSFFKGISVFISCGSLPLFLTFTAFVYLKRQLLICNYLVAAMPIFGTAAVIWIWRLQTSKRQKKLTVKMFGCLILLLLILALDILLLGSFIPWGQTGLAPRKYKFNLERIFKPLIYADLSSLNLSALREKDIASNLRSFDRIRLGGATLDMAVLNHADLKRTYLRGAKLRFADLEGADLSFADVRETKLLDSNLQDANLFHANLIGAYALGANFQKANLNWADFRAARLFLSDFRGADLSHVDFREGSPIYVNFKEANLSYCNFHEVSLVKTDFSQAVLSYANLRDANLRWAVFEGALLLEADLRGALNITVEQLSRAKTLYKARLDPELQQKIREKFPHLLEMPFEEK